MSIIASSSTSTQDGIVVATHASSLVADQNASPFAFPRTTDEAVRNAQIMIVDDETAVAQLLVKYLQQAGFCLCESICDSSIALARIAESEPDIVLLDIQMEPVGGLEILEVMRRDERSQHIPVIILTSSTDETTKITALNLGANDFLTKPFSLSELLARVRNTLSAKTYHDQVAAHNLRLETDAFSDPLTGIANRRAFDYELKRRITDMNRDGVPLGLLMIDIDDFKSFNDRYGHHVGDAVLSNVAREAGKCVRETDLVARYGGEEFSVILPAAALSRSNQVAERILTSIARKRHVIEGQSLQVTVSIGVANAVKGDDADSLVRNADEALYAAKHNGRNIVYFHNGKTCVPLREPDREKISSRGWQDASSIYQARIAIVDDEPAIVAIARKFLADVGYENFLPITRASEALSKIEREAPDMVLLDIQMPDVDGFTILDNLRKTARGKRLPVLVFTSATDHATKVKALSLGANDFLEKPLRPDELAARVRNTLLAKSHLDRLADYSHELERQVRIQIADISESRKQAIQCLARAAELRDDDTGQHVVRVGRYAALIAEELGFSADRMKWIELAAQLHDVGKIGIPDDILRKAGKFSREEFEIMKGHCLMGRTVLQVEFPRDADVTSPEPGTGSFPTSILALAASVAATHHERWDGTGYPLGLAGEEIPIEGRITAVADVFDALGTKRVYKDAIDLHKCFVILEQNRGSHFDPNVLDAFLRRKSQIERTFHEFDVLSKNSNGVPMHGGWV